MGMRLRYLSCPDSSVQALRDDPDLAPSLLVGPLVVDAAAPAGFEQIHKQLAAAGLGQMFPRILRINDDSDSPPPPPGPSLIRPDAVRGTLEKSWHALHFIFTGQADEAPPPLGYLLSGGEELGEDLGYGPARYLKPAEVIDFQVALHAIDRADFDQRFDPATFAQHDIYPGCWDEDRAELLEEYTEYFELLQDDLEKTIQAGEGLLIGIE